ncbi:hypothetical protein [Streptomyces sp. CAU 1734]|uniref:hypothetical protein n=1 Tax=Streptomyces sp. CAU 1734 TaxID=3140360 RepID=UPI0032608986
MTVKTVWPLPPEGVISTEGLVLDDQWGTNRITPGVTLPIDLSDQTYRTISSLVVPCAAGDVFDIRARARVSNRTGGDGLTGYTVGVGEHVWGYDLDDPDPARPVFMITSLNGDNCERVRHHMPLYVDGMWKTPADWPAGHRLAVILRMDAHSTAARSGDKMLVDAGYAHLNVTRWTTPTPPTPLLAAARAADALLATGTTDALSQAATILEDAARALRALTTTSP